MNVHRFWAHAALALVPILALALGVTPGVAQVDPGAGNAAAVQTCRRRRGKGTGAEQVTLPFSCPEDRIVAAIAEAEAAGKGEQG